MRLEGRVTLAIMLIGAVLLNSGNARADACRRWAQAVVAGTLDAALPEASGLAASRRFPGRLYHVNDSGNGPFFHVSDLSGASFRSVRVGDFEVERLDFEDLGVGPCGQGKSCLFIGDIGDNGARRPAVSILVIEEHEHYPELAVPLRIVEATYPDGPRDAEGLAVHPSGDLYLVSKEARYVTREAAPAHVYRLARTEWEKPAAGARMLARVGEIDVPTLAGDADFFGRLVTGFDIAPDGRSFLLLTYRDAFEFYLDLAEGSLPTRPLETERDYRRIPLRRLHQQEGIAYLADGRSFVYDTERPTLGAAEMFRVDCLE